MSWLAIVLFIIEHIPDIIEVIKKIIDLLRGMPRPDRVEARHDLASAIRSGDHDKVREVAKQWEKRCEGVACPSDVLGE